MSILRFLSKNSACAPCPFEPGKVRLKADPEEFRESFKRFRNYFDEAGWTKKKHERRGEICHVHRVGTQDNSLEVYFEDGTHERVPFESVEVQLEVFNSNDTIRCSGMHQLRRMRERFDSETDIDAFDMVSLEPNVAARWFCDNKTRAVICAAIQIAAPLLLGTSLLLEMLNCKEGKPPCWAALCEMRVGWKEKPVQKVINKVLGVLLTMYMYNFIESRRLMWSEKPTAILMMEEGRVFAFIHSPLWCVAGLTLNLFAISCCGFVSVFVIYYSPSPLEILLNALALFFVLDIDDYLVDKTDFRVGKYIMRRVHELHVDDKEVFPTKDFSRYRWVLVFTDILFNLARIVVLLSPWYIAICK